MATLSDQNNVIQEISERIDERQLQGTQEFSADFRIRELEQVLNERDIRLQSAVEELELRNKELREFNEELQTKIEELMKANADFDNLLQNAEVGAVYIDRELCIRMMTPMIEKCTNLLPSDKGKAIFDVTFMSEYSEYVQDIKRCILEMVTIEKEITDKKGIVWLVRSKAYCESEDKVSGVLTTIFDITKQLKAAKYELKALMESVPGGVIRLRYDGGLFVEYANEGVFMLGVINPEILKEDYGNYYDRVMVFEDWLMVKEKIEECLKDKKLLKVQYRVHNKYGGIVWRQMQATVLEEKNNQPVLLGIIASIDELILTQQNLNSVIDNIPGGIVRLFFDGKKVEKLYFSDGMYKMFEMSKEEYEDGLKSEGVEGLYFFKEWKELLFKNLNQVLEGNIVPVEEFDFRTKTGRELWIQARGSVVSRDGEGIILQYVMLDITETKESYSTLRQEREKLDAIIRISADFLFEYDIKTKTMYYTNDTQRVCGSDKKIVNYRVSMIERKLIHPEDVNIFQNFCDVLDAGDPIIHFELRKMYEDGKYHWIEIHGCSISDSRGRPYKIIGRYYDIEERKRREENLKSQSERDSLTGLYNQMTAKIKIDEAMEKMEEGETGILLLVDIDEFKDINDTFGHLFGDAVLCAAADEIREVFKENSCCGRIGGDEFIVFVKNKAKEEIKHMAKELCQRMKCIYTGELTSGKVSCSIGMAECKRQENQYQEAFKRADSALYHMKLSGKGGCVFYGEEDNYELIDERSSCLSGYDVKWEESNAFVSDPQNIVLFAVELLDKTKDTQSAIYMILERTCRFFGIADAVLVKKVSDGAFYIDFAWNRNRGDFTRQGILTPKLWECLNKSYNEDEIALCCAPELSAKEEEETFILAVKILENKEEQEVMLFFSNEKKEWNAEEKRAMKGVASLLAGNLLRLKENQKNSEYMEYILNYDTVTDFPNYDKFLQESQRIIMEQPEESFFVIYCDINNFKFVNETYGYAQGDMLLKRLGRMLQKECKDGIGFSRITSDKFVILLKGYDINVHKRNFLLMARQFCVGMNKELGGGNLVLIGGICEVDIKHKLLATNIDHANIARKSIKHLAATECAEFTAHLQNEIESQAEMSGSMTAALENEEFVVYLQPKIDLKTEVVVGAEALVRWMRKDKTMYYPDMFIPLFEQNGFISRLDYYVLEKVLIWLRKLLDQKEDIVPISLNFSRRHQKEEDFVEHVKMILEKYQIPSEYIEIEITESVFMSDIEQLNQNLSMMKEYGIAVSIDDFGSGYSSLNVLASVTADIIKLDKEFLKQLDGNTSVEFLRYLITMIKHLGFKVIAEGVETEEQKELLKNVECDMAQGYYYARPMPIEEFQDYVKRHKAVLNNNLC